MIGYAPVLGRVALVSRPLFRIGQSPVAFDDFIKGLCREVSYAGKSLFPTKPIGWEQDILAKVANSGYSFKDVDLAMKQKCPDPDDFGYLSEWEMIKTYIGRPRDFRAYAFTPTTYGQLEELAAYYKNLSDPEFPGYIDGMGPNHRQVYENISARLEEIRSALCSGLGQGTCPTPDKNMPLPDIQIYPPPKIGDGIPTWGYVLGGLTLAGIAAFIITR